MNKSNNNGISVIITLLFVALYYFVNSFIIVDINQIINYAFLGIIFISVYIGVIKLGSGKYLLFNRDYLIALDAIRSIYDFFIFHSSHARLTQSIGDSVIKEGNRYSANDKILFISIRLGIVSIITVIWYIIIYNNTILTRNHNTLPTFVIVSILVPMIFLLIILILISIYNIKKKLRHISNPET